MFHPPPSWYDLSIYLHGNCFTRVMSLMSVIFNFCFRLVFRHVLFDSCYFLEIQYFRREQYNLPLIYCYLYVKLLIINYSHIFEETSQTKTLRESK